MSGHMQEAYVTASKARALFETTSRPPSVMGRKGQVREYQAFPVTKGPFRGSERVLTLPYLVLVYRIRHRTGRKESFISMKADCGNRDRKADGFLRYAWNKSLVPVSLALMAIELVISGCAVGPDYVKPRTPLPQAWNTALDKSLKAEPVDEHGLAFWWKALDDPVMNGLIERATEGNLDRKRALSRLQQARAQRTVVSAGLFPSLNAGGSVTKSHSSGQDSGSSNASTSYRAGLDAAWEIDIFGGQRRSMEAADADIETAREDLNDVLVSLSAEVALNYIELRTTQARIAAAKSNLALQEQTYSLEQARHASG
ncbi:hypothetical protein EG829_22350, partial [bacterium]|nr:hypothetical protein [bacterium]